MSNLALLIPIAAISIGPVSWAFTTWVRARHGYPIDDYRTHRMRRKMRKAGFAADGDLRGDMPGESPLAAERKIMLLSNENEKLTGKIGRLEERLAVLERIATDPAERTAREIEALRDR